jgi:hypothetical protein
MHMAVGIAHDRAHVLARILDDHVVASRVIREEGGEVVDLAIVGDVEGLAGGVCGANGEARAMKTREQRWKMYRKVRMIVSR